MNEELVQRIRQCPTLPSLPSIAVQVLDLAQRANVDIAEIARIISKDPALSGKILRTVNSSFYGRSQHVSTISHALVILGLQSVKTLVLGFSLVSNLSKNKSKGFKHIAYWKRSIFAATAARTIANKINLVQQEEAFLAALLMDIGMLVLDQVVGDQYGEIHAKSKSHDDLARLEQETLGMTHAQVGGMIAEQWKLPPLLTVPVSHHHDSESVTDLSLRKLADLVYISGRCADVFVDEEAAPAIADVRNACFSRYKLNGPDTDALLAEIGTRTKEVASLFEINIGSATEYDAILKKANEALVEITLQSQIQASALQEQNAELKQQALTDALTGLANRARFDQFMAEAFAIAQSKKQPLAILMLDVDKFKKINDSHGHPGGDQVLRVLGRLMKAVARPQDLAARYGGEELVLVLPATARATAATIAETIRRAICAKPVQHDKKGIPVSASIGVSVYEAGCPFKTGAQLLKAADLALYNAKNSGRNCVRVFTLKAPTTDAAASQPAATAGHPTPAAAVPPPKRVNEAA
jgi:diguanylate cyclase (GGDEF)-like protein